MVLDVPELEVDRITLEVRDLRAHVSILAELANLLNISVGVDARLVEFYVSAVGGGTDALGDVTVQVEHEGARVTGRGVATDVVEASARAYLQAVNKLVRKEVPA